MSDRPDGLPESPDETVAVGSSAASSDGGSSATSSDGDSSAASDESGEADARAVRALLKRSLSRDGDDAPDLLAGVQRRIRTRSRGKFFADGWSTTQARANYALIGVLTLLLAVLAYYMLSPMGMR